MGKISQCIVAAILAILAMTFSGFVLVKLWSWFIVATFKAVPLTIPQGIGICLVTSVVTGSAYRITKRRKDNGDDIGLQIIKSIFEFIGISVLLLFFGYIILQFM
jgi:hypothetical protein